MSNPTRERFEARAKDLASCATLMVTDDETGQTLRLVPNNTRALGVTLLDYGDGTSGVSFSDEENGISEEMIYETHHVDFYVDDATSGKVRHLHGTGRRSIQVDSGDGYQTMDTSYEPWSLFPIPGWRKRAKVTHFEPYRNE
jgi:hypothetical protein